MESQNLVLSEPLDSELFQIRAGARLFGAASPGQSRLNQWRIMSMRTINNLPNHRQVGTKFASPKDFFPINPVLNFGVGRCSGSFLSGKAPKNQGVVMVQIKT